MSLLEDIQREMRGRDNNMLYIGFNNKIYKINGTLQSINQRVHETRFSEIGYTGQRIIADSSTVDITMNAYNFDVIPIDSDPLRVGLSTFAREVMGELPSQEIDDCNMDNKRRNR